jgi:hypothetical protein
MREHFNVDAFLADEREQIKRDRETVRRLMAGERPGIKTHWTWIAAAIIVGAGLFWLAGFLRAL